VRSGDGRNRPCGCLVKARRYSPPTYAEPESRTRGERLCLVPRICYSYPEGAILEVANGPSGAIFTGEKGRVTINRRVSNSDPPEPANEALRLQHVEQPTVDHHPHTSGTGWTVFAPEASQSPTSRRAIGRLQAPIRVRSRAGATAASTGIRLTRGSWVTRRRINC
jgi:hypothetical protein